ncbi:hypothetical protein GQ457_05G019910 [Hibiscus cannabinus]
MTRVNPTALDYPFGHVIKQLLRRKRKESRAMANPPNNQNVVIDNTVAAVGGNNVVVADPPVQARNRPIQDHLLPNLRDLKTEIVTPDIQATQFELKPTMFNMLHSIGQFGGSLHEDARQHLRSLLEVCDLFRKQGVHEDFLRLKLFPYSPNNRVRVWLNSISSESVLSWEDLCRNFIIRYSFIVMTNKLRNDITSLSCLGSLQRAFAQISRA